MHMQKITSAHFHKRLKSLAILGIVLSCGSVYGECRDIYSCAIDRRWPVGGALAARDGYARVLTIRVIPGQSVDPEAYLVLRLRADGSVMANYEVPDGDSLFAQIRKRSHETPISVEQMAQLLSVRVYAIQDQRRLRELVAEFSRIRMRVALPDAIYLDTTRYDIAQVTVMNGLSLSVHDSDVLPSNELLLWAKKAMRVCSSIANQAGAAHK